MWSSISRFLLKPYNNMEKFKCQIYVMDLNNFIKTKYLVTFRASVWTRTNMNLSDMLDDIHFSWKYLEIKKKNKKKNFFGGREKTLHNKNRWVSLYLTTVDTPKSFFIAFLILVLYVRRH